MSELSRIVAHYLEVIVEKAGLTGFDEMRAEIEAAAAADAATVQRQAVELSKIVNDLVDGVEEKLERPDWRERR